MAGVAKSQITLTDYTDAKSLVTWYQRTTSTTPPNAPTTTQTSQAVANWSKTEPAFSDAATYYLYTVVQVNWGDGSCDWGVVQLSSAYEAAKAAYNKAIASGASATSALDAATAAQNAVNVISIGHRNFLRGTENPAAGTNIVGARMAKDASNDYFTLTPTDSAATCKWVVDYLSYGDLKNGRYVITCEARLSSATTSYTGKNLSCSILYGDRDHSHVASSTISASYYWSKGATMRLAGTTDTATDALTTEWQTFYVIFRTPLPEFTYGPDLERDDADYVTVAFSVEGSHMPVDVRHCQLVMGNTVADWSPAPEDLESYVDGAVVSVKGSTWYATCATASATAAKVATIEPVTNSFALEAGVMVNVLFSSTNTAAVGGLTLNVNGTGAKPIRRYGTTNLASPGDVKAGMLCQFIYDGTSWCWSGHINTDTDTVDRLKYAVAVAAKAAISAGRIAVFDSSGKLKTLDATAFDLEKPILYVGTAYTADDATNGTTHNNNYLSWGLPFNLTNTHSIVGAAAGKAVYIVGTIDGTAFTPTSSVLTCTTPTSADGLYYMRLGLMSTATNAVLESEHPLFAFVGSEFQRLDKAVYDMTPKEGTCSAAVTDSSPTATVTCPGFALVPGAQVLATMSNAGTVSTPALRFNVNSTGNFPVLVSGVQVSATNQLRWAAGAVLHLRYNGNGKYELLDEPRTWHGKSATASGTRAKTDTTSVGNIVVCKGATVNLLMSNSNTISSPTLNVGGTGALSILTNEGATLAATSDYVWPAKATVSFVFNGSAWEYDSGAIKLARDANSAALNAAKTATNYINTDSTGIRIAATNPPADATTYQHLTATDTEFVVDGISELSLGVNESGKAVVRIGEEDGGNVVLTPYSIDLNVKGMPSSDKIGIFDLTNGEYATYTQYFYINNNYTYEVRTGASIRSLISVRILDKQLTVTQSNVSATIVSDGIYDRVQLSNPAPIDHYVEVKYTATYGYAMIFGGFGSGYGPGSVAIGGASNATGPRSVAIGTCTAYGSNSIAEGDGTKACGDFSHACGSISAAYARASFTMGLRTEAINDYSLVCGEYNDNTTRNLLFQVGNGYNGENGEVRSDAFRVTSTGYAYANGFTPSSDRRIKSDIADIDKDDATAFIRSLRPRSYVKMGMPELGFIAQEVEEIESGYDDYLIDISSNCGYEDFRSLKYDALIAPLVAALQQALGRIDALEQRLAELEGA